MNRLASHSPSLLAFAGLVVSFERCRQVKSSLVKTGLIWNRRDRKKISRIHQNLVSQNRCLYEVQIVFLMDQSNQEVLEQHTSFSSVPRIVE